MKSHILPFALIACAHAQTTGTIAYTRSHEGFMWPVQNICTIRADTSSNQCLTTDGHSHSPSWSPDAKRILFIHDTSLSTPPAYQETEQTRTHHPVELSVMDASGANRKVLRTIEPVIHSATWSPDGTTLAITAATALTPGESQAVALFLLPTSGKGELQRIRQNAWTPSWSPDGRRLAFTVEQPRGHWRVHTSNADGTGETAIGNPNQNNGSPAWSPDGKRIAFDQFTGDGRRQQVFVMNADGSNIQQLTTDSAWSCTRPSWSPAGNQLLVSCLSAATVCGMGIYSTGQKMPDCDRRVFLVPASPTPAASKIKLFDHDSAMGSFAPR